MYHFLTDTEKRNLSELLKETPCALQFANAAQNMNFEKPFTVVKTVGKFTANSIKKAVSDSIGGAAWCAVVYFRPERFSTDGLRFARIDSVADRFDVEEVNAARWLPYSKRPDSFYCKGAFEEARKANGGAVYIVVQRAEYVNASPAPARGWNDFYRLPENERFEYIGKKYGRDYVRRIERNGEECAINYKGRCYCKDRKLEKLMGGVVVDKSGYMPLARIEERLQRARKLRADREAAAAKVADFSKEENAIYSSIKKTRENLWLVLNEFNGTPGTISYYHAGRLFEKFFEAVQDMKAYEEKKAAQKHSSPDSMRRTLETISARLETVTNSIVEVC